MAFASVGSIFSTGQNNDSANSSFQTSPDSYNWAAGDFLVIIFGLDNLGTSDAETSQVTAVEVRNSSDVTVDTFTKAVEHTNGSPGANAGATVSIWYLTATAGRPSLGSITATLSGSTTNKTVVGAVFSRDTSKTVQVMAGTKATGEAKSITSGTVTNGVAALLIRGLAIEDNENAIDTATASWTALTDSGAFTTGGGAAANMACGAEYRIMTGAGAGVTSNPGGTSSGDMASAIIAFEEITTGPATHTTTGALTGQIGSVAGSSVHNIPHPASGALTGPGAAISGASVHNKPHPSSGALSGPGSAISGSAAHIAVHPSSGALTGQLGSVTGSAARTRQHAATGAITGPGTAVAGSAARFRAFAASGALAGQGAAVTGSAARSSSAVTHATSGALVGPGSSAAGSAARFRAFSSSGALSGPGASIIGAAMRVAVHQTDGALVGQEAIIAALAALTTRRSISRQHRIRRGPRNDYGMARLGIRSDPHYKG